MGAMDKIKNEGSKNSKVMDFAFHLTDVSGPRLTSSPGFFRAANWAKSELEKMGLVNVQLEPWGDFGKSWQQEKCYFAMTAPYYVPMIAVPRAWTGSTPGKKMLSGEIILIKAKDTVELMQYQDKLKGKIVMTWSTTSSNLLLKQMGAALRIQHWKRWRTQPRHRAVATGTVPPRIQCKERLCLTVSQCSGK
jgi:hypothetical protein